MAKPAISGQPALVVLDGGEARLRTACDLGMALLGASACTQQPKAAEEADQALSGTATR
jgi:hypothetical protein